jgi:hypothetical protein
MDGGRGTILCPEYSERLDARTSQTKSTATSKARVFPLERGPIKTNTYIFFGPHLEEIGPFEFDKEDADDADTMRAICEQLVSEFIHNC